MKRLRQLNGEEKKKKKKRKKTRPEPGWKLRQESPGEPGSGKSRDGMGSRVH